MGGGLLIVCIGEMVWTRALAQLTPKSTYINSLNRCMAELTIEGVPLRLIMVPDKLWESPKSRAKVAFHYDALANCVITDRNSLAEVKGLFSAPVINIDHNTTRIWNTTANHKLFQILRETGFL